MAQPTEHTIKVTADDQEVIEEILESSPFTAGILLRIALRIGLETIKKNPMILTKFLGKKGPPSGSGTGSGAGPS